MIKVKIEGPGSRLVGDIVRTALKAAGIKVSSWYDCTPAEVGSCNRKAGRDGSEVSVISMRAGNK